ncbi:disease resistance-like protein DSC1 [Mercurialis annua]|uniref:disease resistance-like protein DSC1 n=1 Tax=Mercurialis annua TaxID=3986 RepID=UPI0024ACABDF|nr:disease resistance-like protein DSC1 [Mercurialis annua]
MASTSSAKTSYDVFLSFRGADTRDNFTSHLHQKLLDKNILTFIDNRLDRGEKIESSLMKVIEGSLISVVVFSKGYASSPWCLDELVKILECREELGRIVLPIFYHVDPSDVELGKGVPGDGFRKLEAKNKKSMDKWRNALKEVTTLSGWDSKNYRPDSELIEAVVRDIMKKIYSTSYSISAELVGIDTQIEQILSLFPSGSDDKPYFVGLWGMGGIGKTTIAEALFSRISNQFDGSCFLSNVREDSLKFGLIRLKHTLLTELLGDENLKITMFHVLPTSVLERLKRNKVMIVLDDVNESAQLSSLIGDLNSWLSPGSRVIVTSRDKQVLQFCHKTYKVRQLQYSYALRLFNIYAFKQNNQSKDYLELAKKAVKYAQGVPLALKLFGSHLCERSPEQWEIVLDKLKHSSHFEIQEILEISYNELEQETKDIFLDIACFFKGESITHVKYILEKGSGFRNFDWGVMRLTDKCLLTVGQDDVLDMHDLIQEMGREIAQREGSRLRNSMAICQMLTNNLGNEAIRGIYLDLSEIRKVYLHPKAFSRMTNLKFLKVCRHYQGTRKFLESGLLEFNQSKYLHCLPNTLSLLHWENYPYKSLPSKFSMENLVELKITWCGITQLWDGDKCPQNLKRLDLSGCVRLLKLPNLSSAENLEKINIYICESLTEIDSSIKFLYNLIHLCLFECTKLKSLPEIPKGIEWLDLNNSGVEELSSSNPFMDVSVGLNLSGCRNLHKLPEIAGNILMLDISQTKIDELPSSIISPSSSLIVLRMVQCENIIFLPDSICELEYLEELDLTGCKNICKLPPLKGLSFLRKLCLDGTALVEIPNDIVSLSSLRELTLNSCHRLQGLPKLPEQLIQLQVQNCTSLESAELSWYIPSTELSEYVEYLEMGYDKLVNFKFYYGNCYNLDEDSCSSILAEAQFILEEVAITFNNTMEKIFDSYQFCIIGSDIPEWYGYKSQGSSIAIEFPPDSFNISFLGFAFSAVLDQFNLGFHDGPLSFEVQCCFKNVIDVKQDLFSNCMRSTADRVYFGPDHVFIWFNASVDSDLSNWLIKTGNNVMNEASFEFSAFNEWGNNKKKLKVKKCGVHLIYETDEPTEDEPPTEIMKLVDSASPLTTPSNFLEEATELDTSHKRSEENEEEKPHAKGINGFFSKLLSCFEFFV